jgi:hypothetical protein
LWFTVAVLSVSDTFAVSACPFTLRVAATGLLVVILEGLKAAFIFTFVRSVFALGFTITVLTFLDAMTVLAGPIGLWVAATLFSVVVLETTPAALLAVLVRLVITLSLTVTELRLSDAVTIGTSPFRGWVAAADLSVVEFEASVAAVRIFIVGTLICTVITVNLTIALLGKGDALVT